MLEKTNEMAGVFELVNVCPYLGLPSLLVSGRFSAGGAASVQRNRDGFDSDGRCSRKFHEDATDFLNFFVLAEKVRLAQQVSEAELLGF